MTDIQRIRTFARGLIEGADEADPHALVDVLLKQLTKMQRTALIRWAAGELLTEVNRWQRTTPRVGTSWKAEVNTRGLLAQPYYVDGVWRELGTCTRVQVLTIAGAYRDRAARNLARAEEFEQLAERMQATGATTVADLYVATEAVAA